MTRSRSFREKVGVAAVSAAVLAALTVSPASPAVASACPRVRLVASSGLPAPVAVTTGCGRFEIQRNGGLQYVGAARLPVPAGSAWYADLSWYRIERGQLVLGRAMRTVWRSRDRYGSGRGYGVGTIALSADRVAFSFAALPAGWRRTTLYLAPRGGAERAVARGEAPVGWTAAGTLVTWGGKGVLRLRSGDGRLLRTFASRVYTFVFDRQSRALLYLAHGGLERFDGRGLRTVVWLQTVGLRSPLTIEPLGGLVALRDQRRLVVVRAGGGVVSTTPLPRLDLRTDVISSAPAADGSGDVAFTASRGNTGHGSTGTETVYLLRPGARRAVPIFRDRVAFAVCERQAALAWHGRWLLYSTSEGYAAAINASTGAAVDVSRATLRLPGIDENFQAAWAGGARL